MGNQYNIVCISDTHGKHKQVDLPPGDLLVHAGDFSSYGYKHELESFFSWLKKNASKYTLGVVFVAGNHDRSVDPERWREYEDHDLFVSYIESEKISWVKSQLDDLSGTGVHYLENSAIELGGLKIWGSPYSPSFNRKRWAFNADRGEEISAIWDSIPMDTDIVITHTPVAYKLDFTEYDKEYVGCEALRTKMERVKPKLHVCGHIHEGYGVEETPDTVYVNASTCNLRYEPANAPIIINIEK